MVHTISFDPGYGSTKIYGPHGGLAFQSIVAVDSGKTILRMAGLRVAHPPLRIDTDAGAFYIGDGAHDWGRPVENLDFDRLTGAPEMRALLYGAFSQYELGASSFALIVGLPVAALMGDSAAATQQAVREFLVGEHTWRANGVDCAVTIKSVLITSQPVGAMFDYLLTEDGQMPADRRVAFKGEIGILSIGMNTVELLMAQSGVVMQRFTAGSTLGVRRLLDCANHDGLYSLGELDAKLRAGCLPIEGALPVWQSEVLGFVEKHWGASYPRFGTVIIVGGGAILLHNSLLCRFKDKAYIPEDPVIATARGLYKYTLSRSGREK